MIRLRLSLKVPSKTFEWVLNEVSLLVEKIYHGLFESPNLQTEIICDALRDLVSFVQFKNRKNTDGGVALFVKLQAKACNLTKSNTSPWVFFTFLKLFKWYKLRKATHLSISETVSIVASTTKSTVYAFHGLSFPAEKILMLFGNISFQRLQDLPSPILYQWSFSILPENTLSDIQRDQWYEMG